MPHISICNALRSSHLYLFAFILVTGLSVAQPPRIKPTGTKSGPSSPSLRLPADGLLTIENSQIRVGINTNAGGAITYLTFLDSHGGKVTAGKNMVSNPDLGRQIQIALYSGPLDYGAGATSGWTGLAWDPIQAGDVFGNPSRLIDVKKESNLLYAKTYPKQFAFNNSPSSPERKPDDEAIIEHWIRLDGNVVKVHVKVTMARQDKTQYEARQQEFPCMYLIGDYHNMWYYQGTNPFSNGDLTLSRIDQIQPPTTSMFGDVFPTEPWMATTNDNGYGVGLYVVGNNYEWKRGYFGSDLAGDENSTVASYVAAANRVVLDHDLVHEFDYEMVLGHLSEIRSYIYTKPKLTAGPNYLFDKSRKGWTYGRATDTGWPISGKLHVRLDDAVNARISSPFGFWKGKDSPKLYVRAAFMTQSDKIQLRWRRSEDKIIYGTPDRHVEFPIINDGQYHTYEIDLSQDHDWLDHNIGQIEFALVANGSAPGAWAELAWISTKDSGPLSETANDNFLIPSPCDAGCLTVDVKKIQYIRSNRKR